MKWTEYLPQGVYIRLCECRNRRSDLKYLVRAMWATEQNKTKQDIVGAVLEWVGDWNGQYEVTDLTDKEYQELLRV